MVDFRHDWLSSVRSMQREMERLLDYFGSSKPPSVYYARMWEPAIDVYERETEVVVLVELAGVKQDEIEVVVDGNTLVIKGERKEATPRSKRTYYQMEIQRGSFERSILLPSTVDPDKTKASYEDGLLEIVLPKLRQEQNLQVKIKTLGKA
jgi:HSP20 family protein